jgi:hypothetical protein
MYFPLQLKHMREPFNVKRKRRWRRGRRKRRRRRRRRRGKRRRGRRRNYLRFAIISIHVSVSSTLFRRYIETHFPLSMHSLSVFTSVHAERIALGIRLEGYDMLAAKKNQKLNSETRGLGVHRFLKNVSVSQFNVHRGSTAPNVCTPNSVNSDTVPYKEV